MFDPWVRKMPWRREWQLTPVFIPGKSQGKRSLVGYSPGVTRVGHNWANEYACIANHFTFISQKNAAYIMLVYMCRNFYINLKIITFINFNRINMWNYVNLNEDAIKQHQSLKFPCKLLRENKVPAFWVWN